MTEPVVQQATQNSISISYKAFDIVPTLTAEAINIAVEHCAANNLYANYRGVNVPSAFSSEEIHTFVCEPNKTDDAAVIIAQNQRYTELYQSTIATNTPTFTSCNTFGTYTSCTSY